ARRRRRRRRRPTPAAPPRPPPGSGAARTVYDGQANGGPPRGTSGLGASGPGLPGGKFRKHAASLSITCAKVADVARGRSNPAFYRFTLSGNLFTTEARRHGDTEGNPRSAPRG